MRTAKNLLSRGRALVVAVIAIGLLAAAPAAQAAPKRIAALTPFSANTLAGLGVLPVAIGETPDGSERLASNLRDVPRLTLSHPNGPNMDELALRNPKLVFSSPTWAKGATTMRDLGMKVVNADPANVAAAYATTRMIGRAVGMRASGSALAARLQRQVKSATRGIRKRPRTLVVLGVGRTPFVMLPNSWGGSIVKKAGARLITGGVESNKSGFVRISDEKIFLADPDVIIAIPHANSDDIPAVKKFLRNSPAWKDSNAVRKGRLYVTGGSKLLQANTDIAKTIDLVRTKYLLNK